MKVTKCPPGIAKGAENSWPQQVSRLHNIKPDNYNDAQVIGYNFFGYASSFTAMVQNSIHFNVKRRKK